MGISPPSGRFSRTARSRLAAATAALIALTGTLILAVVYIGMRYVNNYRFTPPASSQLNQESIDTPHTALLHDLASPDLTSTTSIGFVVNSSEDVFTTLMIFSAVALVLLSLVGAVASWFVAGRMLRPLRDLSEAANLARAGSLSHRIGATGTADEFASVARAFDGMLSELERSFGTSQRFAANASHELRTPLATTKALLQVARIDEHPAKTRLLLDRLELSNDRLISITDALLDLAMITQRGKVTNKEVDIPLLVALHLDALEEERRRLAVTVTTTIQVDHLRAPHRYLELLFGNLLRNAVRHNVHHGFIDIAITRDHGDNARIIIENSGPLIPPDELERLTEPFFRVHGRAAGRPQAEGHGLGLALVAAVVDTLHGTLALHAHPTGGLRASITLPPQT